MLTYAGNASSLLSMSRCLQSQLPPLAPHTDCGGGGGGGGALRAVVLWATDDDAATAEV
jgi:hypothetical protein